MSEFFTVKADLPGAEKILKNHGLQDSGPVQEFFTSEVMRLSDPYVPADEAMALKSSARITDEKNAIIYVAPHARYHWYGKLMVDPQYKKGAFFCEGYGFWSRPGVKKELTNRNLNYQGAPTRGPRWVDRCWIDQKEEIISATEKFIERYKK